MLHVGRELSAWYGGDVREVRRPRCWWWSRQAGMVWPFSSLETSLHCPVYPFSWWPFSLKTCFTRLKRRILYSNSQTSALPKKPLYKTHCRPPVTLLIMWVSYPRCISFVFQSVIPPFIVGLWTVGMGGKSSIVDVMQRGSLQNLNWDPTQTWSDSRTVQCSCFLPWLQRKQP